MKKIILTLLVLFSFQGMCFAQNQIAFVYLNGSNDNNTHMKNWFENGAKKLHTDMKLALEKNPISKEHLLKNGKYTIESQPTIFYWGDRSKTDLNFLNNNIALLKGVSPWVAYRVRSYIAHCMHDAIWISKYHNMDPVLGSLQNIVLQKAKNGDSVVLYGYSAGSFITYQYLLERLPYISIKDFLNKIDASQDVKDFVAKNPTKPTCIKAVGQSGLADITMSGHVLPIPDKSAFEKNYLALDTFTDTFCAPEGTVKGVINFASPLVLFYSDISDPKFELTYYNRLMFKYLIEHDMFWLTVNYRDDPLGFPVTRNLTIEEVEKYANANIDPKIGFMYDWSDTGSGRTFMGAHTAYWSTERRFSNAVATAYEEGYRHQYDKDFQKKILKRQQRFYNKTQNKL